MSRFPSPNFPKLEWPVTKEQWRALAKLLDQLKSLLSRKLSYDGNMQGRFVELEIRAPITVAPRKRVDGLSVKPSGVLPLLFERTDPVPGPAQMPNAFAWSWSSSGEIVLDSLVGLTGTDRYRIRLLTVEG